MTFAANVEAVRIRPMTVGDLDGVMGIAAGLPTAPQWERGAYETAIDPCGVPGRIALVAEIDEQVIGFTIASLMPPEAELETIAVSARCHRRGVGRALLDEALRELASGGVDEVTLEVRASNVAARDFYRVYSFVEVATRPAYYRDTGEAAIVMRACIPISAKRE